MTKGNQALDWILQGFFFCPYAGVLARSKQELIDRIGGSRHPSAVNRGKALLLSGKAFFQESRHSGAAPLQGGGFGLVTQIVPRVQALASALCGLRQLVEVQGYESHPEAAKEDDQVLAGDGHEDPKASS